MKSSNLNIPPFIVFSENAAQAAIIRDYLASKGFKIPYDKALSYGNISRNEDTPETDRPLRYGYSRTELNGYSKNTKVFNTHKDFGAFVDFIEEATAKPVLPPIEMKVGKYTATYANGDLVKVGCSEIPVKDVLELARKIEERQKELVEQN